MTQKHKKIEYLLRSCDYFRYVFANYEKESDRCQEAILTEAGAEVCQMGIF